MSIEKPKNYLEFKLNGRISGNSVSICFFILLSLIIILLSFFFTYIKHDYLDFIIQQILNFLCILKKVTLSL